MTALRAILVSDSHLSANAPEAEKNWAAEQVGACGEDQRIALISHKPLTADEAELAAAPPYRFLPAPARSRLEDLFGARPPALVISGHVHQYRRLQFGRTDHLWAPTTWAVLPDHVQPVLGTKRCGIASVAFGAATVPEATFAEPDGIVQLTMGRDMPDPYHQH